MPLHSNVKQELEQKPYFFFQNEFSLTILLYELFQFLISISSSIFFLPNFGIPGGIKTPSFVCNSCVKTSVL